MVISSTQNLSLDHVLMFLKQTKARLPRATYADHTLYLIPTVIVKVNKGVKICLGFSVVSESETGSINVCTKITVKGYQTLIPESEISATIAIGSGEPAVEVDNVNLVDDEEEHQPLRAGSGAWNTKQTSIDKYHGCACVLGCKTFTIGAETEPECMRYALNSNSQFEVSDIITVSTDLDLETVEPNLYGFMVGVLGIDTNNETPIKQLLTSIQRMLHMKTGLISPYINVGSLNYMLVESNDFD